MCSLQSIPSISSLIKQTTVFPLLVLRVKSIDCGLILLLLVMGFLSPFTLIASVYNHDI